MGRAEGERHGRTQQYLQLVDHLSWRGERGTGASKARELERRAGGPVVGRGGPRILIMDIQKLTMVIFLTALILVLGMYN